MLSDEEKKAIGQCRLLLNGDITLHIIDDDGGTAYCGIVNKEYNKDLETVLNLIEKQSKEIEELKKNNETQSDCAEPIERTEEMVNMRWVNYNYIGKEKLKARIEEYKNKIKKIRSKKLINEPEDTIIITRYAHYISVLQSLLEKE